jgi:ribosomal protein S18 acetylase RimI-like enzyme
MRVRPARAADLPAVSRLAAELVRLHHRLDPPRFLLVEPVEDGYQWFFSREIKRKGALILVAEDEETKRILGYAYATLEGRNWNDLLDACGKLNDIYVDPTARRGGVGRALVEEAFATLKARGAPRVVLLSAWKNPDAHAFFEGLGFRRTMLEMTAELEPPRAPRRAKRGRTKAR